MILSSAKTSILSMLLGGLAIAALGLACSSASHPLKQQVEDKLERYLLKDSTLAAQLLVEEDGIVFYTWVEHKQKGGPEAKLYWEEQALFLSLLQAMPKDSLAKAFSQKGERHWKEAEFSNYLKDFKPSSPRPKGMQGLRIALDPGHVGGSMEFAEMEKKFIMIRPTAENALSEEISFNEGNLALGTSILLKQMLEEAGAEVLLTREEEGQTAFGGSYQDWLDGEEQKFEAWCLQNRIRPSKEQNAEVWQRRCAAHNYIVEYGLHGRDSTWWMDKAKAADIYRLPFLKAEFKERAKKINNFQPHATFVIHYNVNEVNEPESDGYRGTTPDNFCMAFVPGSFMAGELGSTDDRLDFAAKLFSDDIQQSIALSREVVNAHVEALNIPLIPFDSTVKYLRNASLPTEAPGVFARNLQLTRLIQGPLCFGESLFQDNEDECLRLNAKDFVLPGMTTPLPNRIKVVANAYFEGLKRWLAQG